MLPAAACSHLAFDSLLFLNSSTARDAADEIKPLPKDSILDPRRASAYLDGLEDVGE
jgi:hypothetical protein